MRRKNVRLTQFRQRNVHKSAGVGITDRLRSINLPGKGFQPQDIQADMRIIGNTDHSVFIDIRRRKITGIQRHDAQNV